MRRMKGPILIDTTPTTIAALDDDAIEPDTITPPAKSVIGTGAAREGLKSPIQRRRSRFERRSRSESDLLALASVRFVEGDVKDLVTIPRKEECREVLDSASTAVPTGSRLQAPAFERSSTTATRRSARTVDDFDVVVSVPCGALLPVSARRGPLQWPNETAEVRSESVLPRRMSAPSNLDAIGR